MKINLVLCAVLAMVVIDVNADDVVKGRVGVSLYPTIEEVADAYEKSEMSDWRVVAEDLVKPRRCSDSPVILQ